MASLNNIKNWFKTGSKPTQQQFSDTWDSFWHKDENIPVANIEGVDNLLNQKANKSVVDNHLTDSNAHAEKFSTKEDKSKKGQAGGYVPLDDSSKILAQYLKIVDDLTTGGVDKLLSAQQGVELRERIDQINVLLQSNDVNLDNVQELVDAIKTIQASLATILVDDLVTGGITKALTAQQGIILKQLIDQKVTPAQLQQVARPYKVYTAVMSQSGTNAPQANVLENTIGDIVWSRVSAGVYRGTLASAFNQQKMAFFYGAQANQNSGHFFTIYQESLFTIIIVSGSQYSPSDGNFLPNTIEIRIYE